MLIDPVSLPFLADAEIDFADELIGARFVVNNPNATSILRLRHQLLDLRGRDGRRGMCPKRAWARVPKQPMP